MFFSVGLEEIIWLAAAIVGGGVITGLLAGLFGVGGGSVIVPVLYEVFRTLGVPEEVRMQLCVGTSIAIIVPTALRSYLAHRARGLVIPRVIRLWAFPAVVGVACGAVIAAFAPAAVFVLAFVVIASFIAVKLLFAGDRWNLGNDLPDAVPIALYGFAIGLGGSLMGVRGERRRAVDHRAHGLWQTDPQCAGDLGGARRADHHRRYRGLYPRRASAPSDPAAVLARLRFADRARGDGAGIEFRRALRRPTGLPRRTLEIAFGCFLLLVSLRFLVSLI
jgi:uncharacterized membrane protein YfcA